MLKVGIALAGAGVLVDVLYHGFVRDMRAVAVVNIGDIGHVLTLGGMVLAMTGVIHAAAMSRRRVRQKGERDDARRSSAATGESVL